MFLEYFDLPIMTFLNGFAGRSDAFDHLVYAVSRYDIFKGVPIISLLWFAWFYRPTNETNEQQQIRQAHLLVVFAGSIAAVVVSRILQLVLHVHQRPLQALPGLKFPAVAYHFTYSAWGSFPSDHAMLFFALATGLWQINRRMGGAAFLWTIFVVGLPRIYMGIHYPSDVVIGAVLGACFMLGFERLPFIRKGSIRILAWSKNHAGLFFWMAFIVTDQVSHLFDDFREIASAAQQYFSTGQ